MESAGGTPLRAQLLSEPDQPHPESVAAADSTPHVPLADADTSLLFDSYLNQQTENLSRDGGGHRRSVLSEQSTLFDIAETIVELRSMENPVPVAAARTAADSEYDIDARSVTDKSICGSSVCGSSICGQSSCEQEQQASSIPNGSVDDLKHTASNAPRAGGAAVFDRAADDDACRNNDRTMDDYTLLAQEQSLASASENNGCGSGQTGAYPLTISLTAQPIPGPTTEGDTIARPPTPPSPTWLDTSDTVDTINRVHAALGPRRVDVHRRAQSSVPVHQLPSRQGHRRGRVSGSRRGLSSTDLVSLRSTTELEFNAIMDELRNENASRANSTRPSRRNSLVDQLVNVAVNVGLTQSDTQNVNHSRHSSVAPLQQQQPQNNSHTTQLRDGDDGKITRQARSQQLAQDDISDVFSLYSDSYNQGGIDDHGSLVAALVELTSRNKRMSRHTARVSTIRKLALEILPPRHDSMTKYITQEKGSDTPKNNDDTCDEERTMDRDNAEDDAVNPHANRLSIDAGKFRGIWTQLQSTLESIPSENCASASRQPNFIRARTEPRKNADAGHNRSMTEVQLPGSSPNETASHHLQSRRPSGVALSRRRASMTQDTGTRSRRGSRRNGGRSMSLFAGNPAGTGNSAFSAVHDHVSSAEYGTESSPTASPRLRRRMSLSSPRSFRSANRRPSIFQDRFASTADDHASLSESLAKTVAKLRLQLNESRSQLQDMDNLLQQKIEAEAELRTQLYRMQLQLEYHKIDNPQEYVETDSIYSTDDIVTTTGLVSSNTVASNLNDVEEDIVGTDMSGSPPTAGAAATTETETTNIRRLDSVSEFLAKLDDIVEQKQCTPVLVPPPAQTPAAPVIASAVSNVGSESELGESESLVSPISESDNASCSIQVRRTVSLDSTSAPPSTRSHTNSRVVERPQSLSPELNQAAHCITQLEKNCTALRQHIVQLRDDITQASEKLKAEQYVVDNPNGEYHKLQNTVASKKEQIRRHQSAYAAVVDRLRHAREAYETMVKSASESPLSYADEHQIQDATNDKLVSQATASVSAGIPLEEVVVAQQQQLTSLAQRYMKIGHLAQQQQSTIHNLHIQNSMQRSRLTECEEEAIGRRKHIAMLERELDTKQAQAAQLEAIVFQQQKNTETPASVTSSNQDATESSNQDAITPNGQSEERQLPPFTQQQFSTAKGLQTVRSLVRMLEKSMSAMRELGLSLQDISTLGIELPRNITGDEHQQRPALPRSSTPPLLSPCAMKHKISRSLPVTPRSLPQSDSGSEHNGSGGDRSSSHRDSISTAVSESSAMPDNHNVRPATADAAVNHTSQGTATTDCESWPVHSSPHSHPSGVFSFPAPCGRSSSSLSSTAPLCRPEELFDPDSPYYSVYKQQLMQQLGAQQRRSRRFRNRHHRRQHNRRHHNQQLHNNGMASTTTAATTDVLVLSPRLSRSPAPADQQYSRTAPASSLKQLQQRRQRINAMQEQHQEQVRMLTAAAAPRIGGGVHVANLSPESVRNMLSILGKAAAYRL
jgi:hypothetical protein